MSVFSVVFASTFSVSILWDSVRSVGVSLLSFDLLFVFWFVTASFAPLAAFATVSAHFPSAAAPSVARSPTSTPDFLRLLHSADPPKAPAPNISAFLNPQKNQVSANPISSPCIAPGVLDI